MIFIKRNRRSIELKMLSEGLTPWGTMKCEFEMTFRIGFFLSSKKIDFRTTGVFENPDGIDKLTLIKILDTTDHVNFIQTNIKNRTKGNFDYQYEYKGKPLTINFKTFYKLRK